MHILVAILIPILCSPLALCAKLSSEESLNKILVKGNTDTRQNRQNVRKILEGASKAQNSTSASRQPFGLFQSKAPKVNLGKKNNTRRPGFLEQNKDINEWTFESDMMLNEAQARHIVSQMGSTRAKRQAITDPNEYWDKNQPIYYTFDSRLSATNVANVRKAVKFWNDNSCINFQENATKRNRLFFTSAGGCWSNVGRQSNFDSQTVSVGPGCDGLGTATHEIAHALGFWHMQSRADRDSFVYIDFSNISPQQSYNFLKYSTDQASLLGLPYDYGSVMQYDAYAFAVNPNRYTIYTLQSADQNSLGQRDAPAFSDVRMVNRLYNCSQSCPTQQPCQNFGITNPRNCGACKCPAYFCGRYCTELPRGSAQNCNAQVLQVRLIGSENFERVLVWATNTWQSFNATAGDPNNYVPAQSASDCYWHIKAPVGRTIRLRLTSMPSAPSECVEGCLWLGLEINLGKFDVSGIVLCCPTFVNQIFTTTGNMAAIRGFVRYNQLKFTVQYQLA